MKLEQNCYYFWSVSKSVIFQVERLAEFHCACQSQSYSLPSSSSSFTDLFGEIRTQKCRIHCREPTMQEACMQHIKTSLNSLRLPCVCPDSAPFRCRRCGASTAQIAELNPKVGSWKRAGAPKSHPRSLGAASSFLSSAV